MNILHITPHLGGGIGKALAVTAACLRRQKVKQTFLLLEDPINRRYAAAIEQTGAEVIVGNGPSQISYLASEHDIVQFEFINHPRIFECLARTDFPPMHSVIWCHISGLFKPYIQPTLFDQVQRFVFTSEISLSMLTGETNIAVINSGFGFDEDVQRLHVERKKLIIGYLGTVNFVKMHPGFFHAVDLLTSDVEAHIWGAADQSVVDYSKSMKHPERFIFHGETDTPDVALAMVDIFFYPLVEHHYGTGENALVEAMSIGLPCVVLSNPAERAIITHSVNGIIAGSLAECVHALYTLMSSTALRRRLGLNAIEHVKATRTPQKTADSFNALWQQMLVEQPMQSDFRSAIGTTPAEWFLSTQRGEVERQPGTSKGTLGHFEKVFAGDQSLSQLV